MSAQNFGQQLNKFRIQCHHPQNGEPLTQKKLAECLYVEIDIRYTSAAISDWERGKSRPGIDQRLLLTTLIKILKEYGGIKTIKDANTLLEAGSYRDLSIEEKNRLFPEISQEEVNETITVNTTHQTSNLIKILLGNSLFSSPEEFQKLIDKINDGPSPAWPRMVAAIMAKISDWIEASNPVRMLIWLAIWILAYVLLRPSIQWPFPNHDFAINAVHFYVFASLIIPLLIGLLIPTDKNDIWNKREKASRFMIRLYTYQGAFVGFHAGYFLVFIIFLVMYYLQLAPAVWIQFLLLGLPIFLGIVGARVVPDNLWKAFKRLSLIDGGIFSVFIIVSPFWAWFFLESYPWLTSPICGAVLVLSAFILAASINKSKINR